MRSSDFRMVEDQLRSTNPPPKIAARTRSNWISRWCTGFPRISRAAIRRRSSEYKPTRSSSHVAQRRLEREGERPGTSAFESAAMGSRMPAFSWERLPSLLKKANAVGLEEDRPAPDLPGRQTDPESESPIGKRFLGYPKQLSRSFQVERFHDRHTTTETEEVKTQRVDLLGWI